ncbi:MAG: peptidoglycan DD-metalloendopeptidase family protein [Clostridiales bacterium]|nr:peptidoglycan DD-metalloendopeptidase family protein [Clostridiales bacterium]
MDLLRKDGKRNLGIKRFFAASLTCSVIAASVFVPGTFSHADETLDQLQAKYDKIEQQMKQNEKKMADIKDNKAAQQSKISALESEISGLDDQINILNQKISVLNGDINTLNSSIKDLDGEIADAEAQIAGTKLRILAAKNNIDNTYETISKRLAASYMMGDASTLELLLGSKSLSEFLTMNQYIQNATEYDNRLIEGLEDDIKDLNELNNQLDEDVSALEDSKKVVQDKKDELKAKQNDIQSSANQVESKKGAATSKKSEAVAMLKTLDKESAEFAALQKKLADDQAQIDAEINAYLAAQGSKEGEETSEEDIDIKNDGSLIWPLPYKNCYISAPFGQYPSGGAHHGVDICVHGGTEGKNIVAAQSGKVIQMGYGHWSMGNYVILDHGNGLFTAYYHASVLKVSSVGEKVQQGQVIALAGHTGNTTGPHLHFEVRVNKNGNVVQVNPLNYVSMP